MVLLTKLKMTKLDLKLGCEFIETCPDTIKLRENPGNEDLQNQYDELCTTCGYKTCLLYQILLEEDSNQNGRT